MVIACLVAGELMSFAGAVGADVRLLLRLIDP